MEFFAVWKTERHFSGVYAQVPTTAMDAVWGSIFSSIFYFEWRCVMDPVLNNELGYLR